MDKLKFECLVNIGGKVIEIAVSFNQSVDFKIFEINPIFQLIFIMHFYDKPEEGKF